jgi:integral membrane protein (TIGR01906 family)
MKIPIRNIFTLKNLFITLFAISVPFLILLDNTKQAVVYEGYEDILNQTGAFQRVENVREINQNIIGFLIGTDKEIEELTPREQSHMKDVRWAVQNGYAIYLILLLIAFTSFFILITKYEIKDAANALMIASAVSLIKLILLSTINFDATFGAIHRLLFVEGTWMFSNVDLLIRMYSFDFFQQISRRIVINTAVQAIILGIFGYLLSKSDFITERVDKINEEFKNKIKRKQ